MQNLIGRWLRSAIAMMAMVSLLFCSFPAAAAQTLSLDVTLKEGPFTVREKQAIEDFSEVSLSPRIPADIPISLNTLKVLEQNNYFPFIQEIFDRFAWNEFVALNWPLDRQGYPLSNITDPGKPQWATGYEALQVFRPDGGAPQKETPHLCPNNTKNFRELYATSSVFSNTVDSGFADEVNQAFTTPLYDQNGKEVRYEVFLNDKEYEYIVANKLYNLNGQIEYSQTYSMPVKFPAGDYNTGEVGAIELKLAWKELGEDDIESRFYTQKVLLPELEESGEPQTNSDGTFKSCGVKKMGLVGMHISQKTKSAPQWIWTTFEQVDNILVDDTQFQDGKRLKALFHDYSPAGQTLPVNVPPIKRNRQGKPDANGMKKTQVSRPIPITGLAQRINREYQQALAEVNSPLQYYELIDTQWPTAPYPDFSGYAAVPGSPFPGNLPEGITNKSTGAPTPVYLTNSIMETYFQRGNQPAHFQEDGFPFDFTPVFGTESCMACHFSAGIATGKVTKNVHGKPSPVAVFGGSLTADFSWLLQQKAKWEKVSSPKAP